MVRSTFPTALYGLDANIRRAYDTAVELAPELVRKETPVSVFLATENDQADAAALRLARYWTARQETFEERWLLPLHQTGTGALSMQDAALLRTGFIALIPQVHPQTQQPGIVALYDESKLPKQPGIVLLRCTFYMAALYPQQMQNLTIVHVVTSAPRPAVDLHPGRWDVLKQALPLRVRAVLVAQAYEGLEKQALLDSLGYQELRATEYKSGHAGLPRIAGHSVKHTLQLLQQVAGITPQCIPTALGGTYNYATQFHEWIRTRLSIEHVVLNDAPRYRPCAVPQVTCITAVAKRGTLKRVIVERQQHAKAASTGRTTTTATKTSNKDKRNHYKNTNNNNNAAPEVLARKERNALYSRRSFNKRKMEKLALQNQVALWQAANDELRQQGQALEQALQQAQVLVQQESNKQQTQLFSSIPIENDGTANEIMGHTSTATTTTTTTTPPRSPTCAAVSAPMQQSPCAPWTAFLPAPQPQQTQQPQHQCLQQQHHQQQQHTLEECHPSRECQCSFLLLQQQQAQQSQSQPQHQQDEQEGEEFEPLEIFHNDNPQPNVSQQQLLQFCWNNDNDNNTLTADLSPAVSWKNNNDGNNNNNLPFFRQ